MYFRACLALLLLLSACATTDPAPPATQARSPRLANLQRAAALPWTDEGRCSAREASEPWSVLVERCFHALDTGRIRFRDIQRRCPVASTDAASLETMVGICLLTQPELAVGAVIIIGVVVVGLAIQEELDAHARVGVRPGTVRPGPGPKPSTPEAQEERRPGSEPSPSGEDEPPRWPPVLSEGEPRPECEPRRVPPKGGNRLHNQCADGIPFNAFRGANALVNGKAFDALQPATRTVWEVKTNDFEPYNPFILKIEIDKHIKEGERERNLAAACGYDFVMGVRTEVHKELLEREKPKFKIVVMDWC